MSGDPTLIDPLAGLREKIVQALAGSNITSQDVDTVMAVVRAEIDAALTEREADRAVIVNLIAENNTLRAARRRARAVPVDAPVYYDANTAHGWEAGRNAVLDALGEAP